MLSYSIYIIQNHWFHPWNAPGNFDMTNETFERDGESERLIARLKVFWKTIRNLRKKTLNEIDIFEDYSVVLHVKRLYWKCCRLFCFWRHSTPLATMMEALPHLHFPKGSCLDYYQSGDDFSSYPTLYVRKSTDPRLPNNSPTCLGDLMPKDIDILDNVRPDFTPEGAWELILLMELGDQFNLVRHAGYNEIKIIYDMEEFFTGKYFGNDFTQYEHELFDIKYLTENERKELLSWQPAPRVTMGNDAAVVEYCVFSPFGGFYLVQIKVQFKPVLILSQPIKMKKVHYHCQIIY